MKKFIPVIVIVLLAGLLAGLWVPKFINQGKVLAEAQDILHYNANSAATSFFKDYVVAMELGEEEKKAFIEEKKATYGYSDATFQDIVANPADYDMYGVYVRVTNDTKKTLYPVRVKGASEDNVWVEKRSTNARTSAVRPQGKSNILFLAVVKIEGRSQAELEAAVQKSVQKITFSFYPSGEVEELTGLKAFYYDGLQNGSKKVVWPQEDPPNTTPVSPESGTE